MARGGKRDGAGRKPGIPNHKTAETIAKVEASGLTPLDYMLSVLWDDEADPKDRMEAAKASAPYVHARLASVDVKGQLGLSVTPVSKEQRDAAVAAALRADT